MTNKYFKLYNLTDDQVDAQLYILLLHPSSLCDVTCVSLDMLESQRQVLLDNNVLSGDNFGYQKTDDAVLYFNALVEEYMDRLKDKMKGREYY